MEGLPVGTFNIRHGLGSDGRFDLDRTASVIRAMRAKLIALQELDRNMERSGGVDQPAALAEKLGLDVVYFPTLRRGSGEYGIAIAAEGGLSEVSFQPLPQRADEEPRGVIVARWRDISVVATHVSSDPAARPVQLDALAALAADLRPPVVLMGDLNSPGRALAPLEASGLRGPGRKVPTQIRYLILRKQIDHVLAGRGLVVVDARALRTRASDHFPLVGRVRRG